MHFSFFQKLSALILIFIILNNCQFQEPSNNHGIIFLENRAKKLSINKSNSNDVLDVMGQPHSKSISSDNEWIYIERILTKGEFHKLGRNVLKENNVLLLTFDKYGILKQKEFFNKEDKKKMKFSTATTENSLTEKSFIDKFLQSVKSKMYRNR